MTRFGKNRLILDPYEFFVNLGNARHIANYAFSNHLLWREQKKHSKTDDTFNNFIVKHNSN